MSPSHVVEPTYRKLKQRLLEGAWPLGHRLEAARLADELGVSMTPVRDCLNRLVGERLVDLRPGEGFRVAYLNEGTLRDLFEFNAALLVFAVHVSSPGRQPGPSGTSSEKHAEHVAALFEAIAKVAGNAVLRETVAALNDRLHAARCLDTDIFGDCDPEIQQITAEFHEGSDKDALRHRLIAYHERRKQAASRYIRALGQSAD